MSPKRELIQPTLTTRASRMWTGLVKRKDLHVRHLRVGLRRRIQHAVRGAASAVCPITPAFEDARLCVSRTLVPDPGATGWTW